MTVARRVAEERGTEVGREVGYAVRFEDWTCGATRIKYLTGALLSANAVPSACSSRDRNTVSCCISSASACSPVLSHLRIGDQAGTNMFFLVSRRRHAVAGGAGGPRAEPLLGRGAGRGARAQPQHRHPVRRPQTPRQAPVLQCRKAAAILAYAGATPSWPCMRLQALCPPFAVAASIAA